MLSPAFSSPGTATAQGRPAAAAIPPFPQIPGHHQEKPGNRFAIHKKINNFADGLSSTRIYGPDWI